MSQKFDKPPSWWLRPELDELEQYYADLIVLEAGVEAEQQEAQRNKMVSRLGRGHSR